jgi:hypothetical protein
MSRSVLAFIALSMVVVSGCRIQVDKSKDGQDKNVKIETPMGGLHVKTNDMTAADVGLPERRLCRTTTTIKPQTSIWASANGSCA